MDIIASNIDNGIIDKLNHEFTTNEQQLFVKSFQTYLKHGDDPNAFVINLDDVWHWLGFARRDNARKAFIKNFEKETDYVEREVLRQLAEHPLGGGHNKKDVFMNVQTFKDFCMTVQTDRGKQIRNYYLKMEKILFKYIHEESQKKIKALENQIKIDRHNMLRKAYSKRSVVYLILMFDLPSGGFILKIGHSDDIYDRVHKIASDFGCKDLLVLDVYECEDNANLEKFIHNHPYLMSRRYNETINKKQSREMYAINSIDEYKAIIRIIDNNVIYYKDKTRVDKILTNRRLELEAISQIAKMFENDPKGFLNAISVIHKEESETSETTMTSSAVPVASVEATTTSSVVPAASSEAATTSSAAPTASVPVPVSVPSTKEIAADYTVRVNQEISAVEASSSDFASKARPTGSMVQVYDAKDTSKLLYLIEGITEATRKFPGSSYSQIKSAATDRFVYIGFRWHLIYRDDPAPNEARDIGPTSDHVCVAGLIASLNKEKTAILKVYLDAYEAAKDLKINSKFMIAAVNNQTELYDQYFTYWYHVSEDLQRCYLERAELPVRETTPKGKPIQQINPSTNEVIKIFPSITAVQKAFNMSPQTIKDYCAKQEIKNGFLWKFA